MQKVIILFFILLFLSANLVAQRGKIEHHISPKLGLGHNGEFLIAELDYIIDYNFARKWRVSSEIGFFNRYGIAPQSIRKNFSFYGTGGALQIGRAYKKGRGLFLRVGYFYFDLDNSVYSLGVGYDLSLPKEKSKIQLVVGIDQARDLDFPFSALNVLHEKRYFSITIAFVKKLPPILVLK